MSTIAFGQSPTISNFEKSSNGYKVFLYQSVIRMLNKDQNPEFNKLIKDLDHLRLLSNESDALESITTFTSLDNGIKSEGFDLIMSYDNKERKCHVYELESNKGKSTWVITFLVDSRAGLMEMKGTLDLKYLSAISHVNFDKLEELIPMGAEDWN